MMEKFFATLRGMMPSKKPESKEAETLEAPTLQTQKTKEFNALPDVTSQVEGPHEQGSPHLLETLNPADVKEYVETLNPEDLVPDTEGEVDQDSPTFKTDATVALEKENLAAKAPTVRTEETMALKAEKAQTFKTGKTIEQEEALAEARDAFHASVAAEKKETLRDLDKGYMEYGQIHSRVTDWLKRVDELMARSGSLEELKSLKQLIEGVKVKVEGQLDVEQYGIAQSEPGATPFKIEVPDEWPEIEARLNEINEATKAGGTIREPMEKEGPTIQQAA